MSISDPQSLQSLAFLYLTFGQTTDGALSIDEMRALATRLQNWATGADLQAIGGIIKSAVTAYKAENDKLGKARELAGTLKGNASTDELSRVLADLKEIANADGTISAEEQAFIDAAAADFGVDAP